MFQKVCASDIYFRGLREQDAVKKALLLGITTHTNDMVEAESMDALNVSYMAALEKAVKLGEIPVVYCVNELWGCLRGEFCV